MDFPFSSNWEKIIWEAWGTIWQIQIVLKLYGVHNLLFRRIVIIVTSRGGNHQRSHSMIVSQHLSHDMIICSFSNMLCIGITYMARKENLNQHLIKIKFKVCWFYFHISIGTKWDWDIQTNTDNSVACIGLVNWSVFITVYIVKLNWMQNAFFLKLRFICNAEFLWCKSKSS